MVQQSVGTPDLVDTKNGHLSPSENKKGKAKVPLFKQMKILVPAVAVLGGLVTLGINVKDYLAARPNIEIANPTVNLVPIDIRETKEYKELEEIYNSLPDGNADNKIEAFMKEIKKASQHIGDSPEQYNLKSAITPLESAKNYYESDQFISDYAQDLQKPIQKLSPVSLLKIAKVKGYFQNTYDKFTDLLNTPPVSIQVTCVFRNRSNTPNILKDRGLITVHDGGRRIYDMPLKVTSISNGANSTDLNSTNQEDERSSPESTERHRKSDNTAAHSFRRSNPLTVPSDYAGVLIASSGPLDQEQNSQGVKSYFQQQHDFYFLLQDMNSQVWSGHGSLSASGVDEDIESLKNYAVSIIKKLSPQNKDGN